MGVRARQPNLRLRSLAAGAGLLLLAQAIGLNLLCFCGSCELSQAIGLHADGEQEHPCCREAKARERQEVRKHTTVSGEHRCCDGAHGVTSVDANVCERQAVTSPQAVPVFVALPQGTDGPQPHQRTLAVATRPRAPPLRPGPALYLQHASLLI